MGKRYRFFVAGDDRAGKYVRAAESRGEYSFERVSFNSVCVLRNKSIFSEYQARRNTACADVCGIVVYVFRAARVYGRVYAVDETGSGVVSDGVYANHAAVRGADDVFGEYAIGAWNNACGKRSAENSATVRAGQFREIQYDECGTRNEYGDKFEQDDSKGRKIKMKENNELERKDMAIDRDIEVNEATCEITAYIEMWFDVDKKFATDIAADDDAWLNMYAKYNPFTDTLKIECEIDKAEGNGFFEYKPTEAEEKLVKEMIAEAIEKECGQTPQEFCRQYLMKEQSMG